MANVIAKDFQVTGFSQKHKKKHIIINTQMLLSWMEVFYLATERFELPLTFSVSLKVEAMRRSFWKSAATVCCR